MDIQLANESDLDIIKKITNTTIKEIYPHYYPEGAVAFFLNHHNTENIMNDISNHNVFICYDLEKNVVGTVTIKKNEICRLFVLPKHQGKGYGRNLMEYAETIISKHYEEIILDASLSAKAIYLNRGYRESGYYAIKTDNSDYLCYDVMKKKVWWFDIACGYVMSVEALEMVYMMGEIRIRHRKVRKRV